MVSCYYSWFVCWGFVAVRLQSLHYTATRALQLRGSWYVVNMSIFLIIITFYFPLLTHTTIPISTPNSLLRVGSFVAASRLWIWLQGRLILRIRGSYCFAPKRSDFQTGRLKKELSSHGWRVSSGHVRPQLTPPKQLEPLICKIPASATISTATKPPPTSQLPNYSKANSPLPQTTHSPPSPSPHFR